jgi:hypothetical protein
MTNFNKYSALVFVLLFNSVLITAQVSEVSMPGRPMNAIFWSVGGGATYMSFEYERLFGRGKSFFLSTGAGLGSAFVNDEAKYKTLPFHFSGNMGWGTSFFECGVGMTLIHDHPERDGISYIILGYRLALPVKHRIAFAFRIHLDIPLQYFNIIKEGDLGFIPLGMGLGISF